MNWAEPLPFMSRLIEILLISGLLYVILSYLRGTVGVRILLGMAWLGAILLAVFAANKAGLEFPVLFALGDRLLTILAVAFLVIFQPELRRGFLRIGHNPLSDLFSKSEEQVIEEILEAVEALSREKVGALIAVERKAGLNSYVDASRATPIGAEVTSQLLRTIFWPNTALHDGGVVIRGGRIAAAGCFFPLSDAPNVPSDFGSRHRAALGLSEETDAVAIVVSEETGSISVARAGKIERVADRAALGAALRMAYEKPGT